jgi:aminoglycoside 3-N-acetyltransferase
VINADDITEAVASLGVGPGDSVFVHSGLQSALRVEGRSRDQKLATIVRGLRGALPQGVLMLPAFSFSYCKGEEYDVERTPSTVGVLPEYFRRLPETRRTLDPIYSASVIGELPTRWEDSLFRVRDTDALGDESVFGFMREQNVKLLFFGVPFATCTYVHHIEQRLGVPYRYFKEFSGVLRDGSRTTATTARFYVRDLDADVQTYLAPLGEALLRESAATTSALPRGPSLYLTDALSVESLAARGVRQNPDYLLARGHQERLAAAGA